MSVWHSCSINSRWEETARPETSEEELSSSLVPVPAAFPVLGPHSLQQSKGLQANSPQANPETGPRKPAAVPPDTTKDREGPSEGSVYLELPWRLGSGRVPPEGPSSELRMALWASPSRPPQLPCLCRCWFGKEPGDLVDYIYQGPIILVLLVRPRGI